jgi:hypothetical protein
MRRSNFMSDTPDTRSRDSGSSADRKTTITQTTAMTGGAGGSVIVLMYAIACMKAHTLAVPTIEQAAGVLIIVGPFLHLLGRVVMYWTGKLLPKDAST